MNKATMSDEAQKDEFGHSEDSFSVVTSSQEETIEWGRRFGELVEEGQSMILTGDLGAGKTQFTKGLAQALGVLADVTSPTFTIEMVYPGRDMELFHFDLYRLNSAEQLEDTGIFDVLGVEGFCALEWGEMFRDELGDIDISLTMQRLSPKKSSSDAAVTSLDDGKLSDYSTFDAEPQRQLLFIAESPAGQKIIEALKKSVKA